MRPRRATHLAPATPTNRSTRNVKDTVRKTTEPAPGRTRPRGSILEATRSSPEAPELRGPGLPALAPLPARVARAPARRAHVSHYALPASDAPLLGRNARAARAARACRGTRGRAVAPRAPNKLFNGTSKGRPARRKLRTLRHFRRRPLLQLRRAQQGNRSRRKLGQRHPHISICVCTCVPAHRCTYVNAKLRQFLDSCCLCPKLLSFFLCPLWSQGRPKSSSRPQARRASRRSPRYIERVKNSEMVPRGLEPRTLRLLAVRSNQLSYETVNGNFGRAAHPSAQTSGATICT